MDLNFRVPFMFHYHSVSVIVRTYSRAEQLSRIVGLLWNQNYPKDKYEIIIVDSGSSDNTKSKAEYLMEKPGWMIPTTETWLGNNSERISWNGAVR